MDAAVAWEKAQSASAAAASSSAAAAATEATANAKKPITRVTPPEKLDPSIKYAEAKLKGSQGSEWGTGDAGYKAPKKPEEKLRKNVPYKVSIPIHSLPLLCLPAMTAKLIQNSRMQYKFRRNWGDF